MIPRKIVRAATTFALLAALAIGVPVARAWRQVSAMSLRTGHRIATQLARSGPAIRTALLTRAPPPQIASTSPDAQLVAHLRAVLAPAADTFAAYQLAFQRSHLS